MFTGTAVELDAERGMNLRRYFFTLLVVLPLSSPPECAGD